MHAVKRNDPEVQTNKTKLDAIRRPAPVMQRQVADPVKEMNMARSAAVFPQRVCICGCGQSFTPSGPSQKFFPGHKPKYKPAKAVKTAAPKKAVAKSPEPAKAMALPGLVDLGKLKADLLAKLAAIELVEKAAREL
jgi:hypothetical protein